MSDGTLWTLILAALLLALSAIAVVDMWRDGRKWGAITLANALWVVILIAIGVRLGP